MAEKIISARLVNKHDTPENWESHASFVPKQGEFIVYDKDNTNPDVKLKIGDGCHNVGELPFFSSPEIILRPFEDNPMKRFKMTVDEYGTICLVPDNLYILFKTQDEKIFQCGDGNNFVIRGW